MRKPLGTGETLEGLLTALRQEYPGFRLKRKPGAGWCGPLLGSWFFISSAWETYPVWQKYIILRHARVHLRQYRRWGLGAVWLGVLPLILAYLFVPLPIGFAWCRYALERAAFEEEMRVRAAMYGHASLRPQRSYYVQQLTGRAYWWAWPWRRSVEHWVDRAIQRVTEETAHA